MGKPLKALIVEDVEQDALLVALELRRGGFDLSFERVDTPEAMSEALTRQSWDVVISDYSMPRFSAPLALALVKERNLDLPFIIVSGTVGEDIAVEAMHGGAQDFMAKGKLARLNPAVERELRDVTLRAERAKMQKQLLISDRMASVGTLATGVAHEINNPLAALMTNLSVAAEDVVQLARKASDAGSAQWMIDRLRTIEEPLRDAFESADRVRNIVRDLKVFSRSEEEKRGAVDVHEVMDSSLRMAWNEVRHRARLVKVYGEVPLVEGNEGRLGQVFLNLVVNAAQAMPDGQADANEIRIVTKQDDRGQVVVEVHDTGAGIPEAFVSRIFDPFFTTKAIGEGTGLGLAICHRIITSLGGELSVESKVGKGSVFRTFLPPAKSDAVAAPPAPSAIASGRRGRILVVDDEPLLRIALQRMFSHEHEVLAVASGLHGIERVSGGEHFDVILCDLMMPEVTGMDLHAELMRIAPDQADRMIFMTGGAFTSRARDFLDKVRNPRVEKPFEVSIVRGLVHAMLR
jgi:signal transduction histidine kinase